MVKRFGLMVLVATSAFAEGRWLVAARDLRAVAVMETVAIDQVSGFPEALVVTEGDLP